MRIQLLDQDEKRGATVPQVRNTTGEGASMNEEKLRFVSGKTRAICVSDAPDCYEATINVIGEEVWLNRICVYGVNEDDANGLRDRLLWALAQPTVPAQWQYKCEDVVGYSDKGEEVTAEVWHNLDNGGEAARLKGEGYEIRALYAKQPLVKP